MKQFVNYTWALTLLLVLSCSGSKSKMDETYKGEQYKETKALIDSGKFKFNATASFPLQTNAVIRASDNLFGGTNNIGSRRPLTGEDAYFIVSNDSVRGRMAYVGEMRVADYTDDRSRAIVFDNTPFYYKVTQNDAKRSVEVKFKVKNLSEQFDIKMDVFSNKSAIIFLYSDGRTAIRYEGAISSF